MQCPPEIAGILIEILRVGLLRIRSLDNADRSAMEADHLHNLPNLLADFHPELLDFYWNVGRVSFIERNTPTAVQDYEALWEALAKHIPAPKRRAIAG